MRSHVHALVHRAAHLHLVGGGVGHACFTLSVRDVYCPSVLTASHGCSLRLSHRTGRVGAVGAVEESRSWETVHGCVLQPQTSSVTK